VSLKILDNYDNVEDASDEEEAFWAEIEIIKQLDHPCILNVYDFYEDSEHYYVVLELLSGNELFDQIIEKGYYDEPEAVAIIYQVLLALEHLESKHICHLDLKPENILFTDDTHTRIKLIDFGEASSCKDHKLTGWVGTNNYMAPEMIKHSEYDCKVDMWSLGVVTYIMLCGSFAFDAEDEIELYQDIMEMRYEFRSPEWDHVSEDAKDFVSTLLTGPIERMSATQALSHRWINTNLPLSGFDHRCLLES
jgi:serine/threonine protein kinase